ncbi:MAG TPA: 4-hydroxy-tetrahydrodipicolinate reductase [Oscillatoriaceae cyanobacterium]
MKTRVVLTGAAGKMGREAIRALHATDDLTLVGAVVRGGGPTDAGELAGLGPIGVEVVPSDARAVEDLLARTHPDVVLDFTGAEAATAYARLAFDRGACFVTGATGFSPEQLDTIKRGAESIGRGALVAPNFAIGALLMIQFAKKAAEYFDHAEIIELHHNQKKDAPSGTALKTAEALGEVHAQYGSTNVPETEKRAGARGAETNGIRIHSVRLPGLLAHQEVIFGGAGQALTIRHDALSRECYMPGVLLAVRKVLQLKGYVFGLEHLL